MTDYKKYINALRKCAKEHENDITSFAHIRVSDLCRDTANLLETLEQEPILDKIRAEIEALIEWHDCPIEYDNGNDAWYCEACNQAIKIIDKYKVDIRGEE